MLPAIRRHRSAQSRSIQAPTAGLDTSAAWANMPEDRAIKLLNLFPDNDQVVLRAGSMTRVSGMPDTVSTLMTFASNTGTQKLFAATANNIYDVTPPAASATSVVSGMSNGRWQWTNYGTLGGQWLIAVNGVNEPRLYDGTTWAATAITGDAAQSTFTWVTAHQRRLWFGIKDSLDVCYLGTDAIAGAATMFYLGPVAQKGGHVIAMGTWTRDSGAGPDDVAVFVTSEGELLVYQGTDPSSVSTWGLVGVFDVGRPVGVRCLTKFGGDLMIVTENGVLPMSRATTTERAQQGMISFSSKVNKSLNESIRLYGGNFGWQIIVYPRGRMFVVNIPLAGTKSEQYVFNTLTGAACQFTGLDAKCWGLFDERLFFGTADGRLVEADTGATDDGLPIDGDVIQAFSYFSSPGVEKAFKRVAPVIISSADPKPAVQVYTNFNLARFTAQPQQPISSDSLWGHAKWGVDKWQSVGRVWTNWIPVEGVGRAATIRIRMRVLKGRPAWVATTWSYIGGGSL